MWRGTVGMKRLRAILAITLCGATLLAGSGCAGPTRHPIGIRALPPNADPRAELGLVAVAAGSEPTVEIEISGRPASRTAATLLDATAGAGLPIMLGLGIGLSTGPFAPFVIAAGIILAPAGLVVGTVVGLKSAGAGDWDAQERATRPTLASSTVHELLQDRVIMAAPARTQRSMRTVSGPDADTLLEVTVKRLALEGEMKPLFQRPREGSSLALTMRARVRLIRTVDNVELYRNEVNYSGRQRRVLGDWAADNATSLQQELHRAYGVVAEKIVADVFMLDPDARAIDEEPSGAAVPETVRREMARELDSLRDRGELPPHVRIRYRFVRYDPGRRFMVFLRTHQSIVVEARVLASSGYELGRTETEEHTGEVLYPDPMKGSIRRIAACIAAYARERVDHEW